MLSYYFEKYLDNQHTSIGPTVDYPINSSSILKFVKRYQNQNNKFFSCDGST